MKLFVKDLTVIDASYLCAERGMVGESWILDVEMSGALNEMSMVLDFGRVKKQIKQLVDEFVDHRLLIPAEHPNVAHLPSELSDYAFLDMTTDKGNIHLHCPTQALCLVNTDVITIQSVTQYLHTLLLAHLPQNVTGLELTLRHEVLNEAFYHYSHGLKKHDGNCQRIAHGHRSPIEIWIDGDRSDLEEQRWANRWQDVYLAAKEDVCSVEALTLSENATVSDGSHMGFAYDAPQGHFELAMPRSANLEVLETDTTVELLAEFIADTIKSKYDTQSVKIVAFEGVGKGAIACR